jgi:hypothetical protein
MNASSNAYATMRPEGIRDQLMVSVGLPLGPLFALDELDPVAGVRCGSRMCELTPHEYETWLRAAETCEAGDLPEEPTEVLEEGGLLLRLTDHDRLLDRHRLVATGIGLGNSASAVGSFRIAARDLRGAVAVDAALFGIWASGAPTLRDVIAAGAEAEHLVLNLPAILGARVAYLDAVS